MILRIPAFIRTIAHDINAATPTTVIGNGFFYHDKQHYISFHHLPFNHYPLIVPNNLFTAPLSGLVSAFSRNRTKFRIYTPDKRDVALEWIFR